VTEVVPLSSPMISVTGTGFLVPFKLASNAAASSAYRLVPVGSITTPKATPWIWPKKVNDPNPFPLKEPGGMVTVKVPTCRITFWVNGWMPLLALPKVKFE
jgi:hypothetical protein